jgi:hypothetical protein
MSVDALEFLVVVLAGLLIIDVTWEVFKIRMKNKERKDQERWEKRR